MLHGLLPPQARRCSAVSSCACSPRRGSRSCSVTCSLRLRGQSASRFRDKFVTKVPYKLPASHSRSVLSSEPETMRRPSGEKATLQTPSSCPRRGSPIGWPVAASHSRSVLSHRRRDDAPCRRARRRRSRRRPHARAVARRSAGRWRHPTAAASCPQRRETMRVPSGEKATLQTRPSWPRRARRSAARWRVPQPQRLVVASRRRCACRRARRRRSDSALMPAQRRADRLPGGGIPQPQRLVLGPGDDARAVGREGDADDASPHARAAARRSAARWRRPTAAASCHRSPRRCARRRARRRRS